ncbi:hypothetical protein TNCV_2546941 [Trichonephila clavipes]|nr:hypothetical protein TNCV_2546941 [Trichonephila clavipes]
MPKRDSPYLILTQKSPTSYVIASLANPSEPITTYQTSALAPFKNMDTFPVAPLRKRPTTKSYCNILSNVTGTEEKSYLAPNKVFAAKPLAIVKLRYLLNIDLLKSLDEQGSRATGTIRENWINHECPLEEYKSMRKISTVPTYAKEDIRKGSVGHFLLKQENNFVVKERAGKETKKHTLVRAGYGFRVLPELFFSGSENVEDILEYIENNVRFYEIPSNLVCAYLKSSHRKS